MDIYRSNEYKNYISAALYNTALIVVTGSMLQTFLLEFGVSEQNVSNLVAMLQIVQGGSMLLCSSLVERIKNVIAACAIGVLGLFPLLFVMLFLGISGSTNITAIYTVICVAGCITNVALGVYNVIIYKLPYHIMAMENYGRITANSGVICGILGIAVSSAMTFFLTKYNYFTVMNVILILSIIMIVSSSAISFRYKRVNDFKESRTETKKINIFTYKPFYILLIPNLTRGICMGFINVAVTIGYYFSVIDSIASGYIVVITNAAGILSCIIYSRIAKRGRNGIIILIFSAIVTLMLPVMLIGKNTTVFLIAYGVVYLAVNVAANAIPVSVTEFVEYDVMGQYTAWRMMLMTIGTSIGGILATPMLSAFGGILTLAVAGLMQLITGLGYYIFLKKLTAKTQ